MYSEASYRASVKRFFEGDWVHGHRRQRAEYAERTLAQRAAFLDGFGPLAGDLVDARLRANSLADARTKVLLPSNQNRIRSLVIAGAASPVAILATVVDAAYRDYAVVVATDCVASTKPTLHRSAMELMPAWADVVTSREQITKWPEVPAMHSPR